MGGKPEYPNKSHGKKWHWSLRYPFYICSVQLTQLNKSMTGLDENGKNASMIKSTYDTSLHNGKYYSTGKQMNISLHSMVNAIAWENGDNYITANNGMLLHGEMVQLRTSLYYIMVNAITFENGTPISLHIMVNTIVWEENGKLYHCNMVKMELNYFSPHEMENTFPTLSKRNYELNSIESLHKPKYGKMV